MAAVEAREIETMPNTTSADDRRWLTGSFDRVLAALFAIAIVAVLAGGSPLAAQPSATQDPATQVQDPAAQAQDPTAQVQDPAAQAQDPQAPAQDPAVSDQEPTGPTSVASLAEDDPLVDLFVSKCSSCHSIGSGDRVGPDLSGVLDRRDRAWLTQMIGTPSRMLASDADARQLLTRYGNVKMPDQGLSDEQVADLIGLIERCSLEPCDLSGTFVPVTEATATDVRRGENLFLGYEPLANGAVSCVGCHTVRGAATWVPGGTLAVDLTNTYARLGDEGLDAALKSPAFLLMNKIFIDHPLEADEAFALRAYLHEVNLMEPVATRSASLPLFGVLGAGLVLAILNAFWARRLRGVRQPLTHASRARTDHGAGGTLS